MCRCARRWICIGTIDDVPNPGDARPVSVAASEVLLVRDGDGAIQVLHNFYRHRGQQRESTRSGRRLQSANDLPV